jgi:ABC-2 type transport system permease protein
MLAEIKRHIKFMALCVKYNLAREMENRGAFVMQILGMVLNDGLMILQWIILFSFTDTIGGYGFSDVMLVWAVSVRGRYTRPAAGIPAA